MYINIYITVQHQNLTHILNAFPYALWKRRYNAVQDTICWHQVTADHYHRKLQWLTWLDICHCLGPNKHPLLWMQWLCFSKRVLPPAESSTAMYQYYVTGWTQNQSLHMLSKSSLIKECGMNKVHMRWQPWQCLHNMQYRGDKEAKLRSCKAVNVAFECHNQYVYQLYNNSDICAWPHSHSRRRTLEDNFSLTVTLIVLISIVNFILTPMQSDLAH